MQETIFIAMNIQVFKLPACLTAIALLICLLLPANAKAQETGQANDSTKIAMAMEAYNQQDYPTALELFKSLAQDGNHIAQAMTGIMYASGQGTSANPEEAVKWYAASAHGGNTVGQSMLALAYYTGQGVPKSASAALYWTEKRIAQGDDSEEAKLSAELYRIEAELEKEEEKYKKWDEIAESMMAVGQTLANTASSMAENAADNSTGNSTYAYADNGTDGDKGISSHPSKDEERAAKRKELKEKEMTNRKFLAAYRTASRAYTRAEDNLRDMRDNSERYLHLSVEQYCSKIDQIQEEMRALREKIETEYDTRQYKSPLEDWKPDCCR